MKTKKILLGLTFFFIGMAVMFGIHANTRHQHFNNQVGFRKSAVIEVGAPLTLPQLKHMGFI
jgi:hypothetical protein